MVREPADAVLVVTDRDGTSVFRHFEVLNTLREALVIRELPNFAIIHTILAYDKG